MRTLTCAQCGARWAIYRDAEETETRAGHSRSCLGAVYIVRPVATVVP